MGKTVYFVSIRYNKLIVGEVQVDKETEKLYYLSRTSSALGDVRILKKTDENVIDDKVSWTTNRALYEKLKKAFVSSRKKSLKSNLASDKELLKKLIKDAKELKIKVEWKDVLVLLLLLVKFPKGAILCFILIPLFIGTWFSRFIQN